MGEVVKGNFESEGLSIGDKRAIALYEWMEAQNRPVTASEIKEEMERLRRIMPAPEDTEPKMVFLPATACRDIDSCTRHSECMYLGCSAHRPRRS